MFVRRGSTEEKSISSLLGGTGDSNCVDVRAVDRVPAMRWFVASTWDMSKDVIDMACDESRWELLAEVISHVHRCIYSFEGEEIGSTHSERAKNRMSMCRVRGVA